MAEVCRATGLLSTTSREACGDDGGGATLLFLLRARPLQVTEILPAGWAPGGGSGRRRRASRRGLRARAGTVRPAAASSWLLRPSRAARGGGIGWDGMGSDGSGVRWRTDDVRGGHVRNSGSGRRERQGRGELGGHGLARGFARL
ncbi:hypothetical protein HU200_002729 [Digitaria exilis]|uniref:Uncharacterized protein n=1 Tax=Digitaria exilis TaxID=1010633 RepID=A0A835FWF2_9POAL|nr:hypothetical protein HU200_002729 [Digitaria exilis]